MKTINLMLAGLLAACVAVESEAPEMDVRSGDEAHVDLAPASSDASSFAWRLLEARGSAALLAGRDAEAHAAFSAVPLLELDPELYPLAGRAALLVGESQIARRLLHAFLERQPEDHEARLDLARALLLLDEASRCLDHLAMLPRNVQRQTASCELRGLALLATGEARAALTEFRRALKGGSDVVVLSHLIQRAREQLAAGDERDESTEP
ncbi:MAG: hypothetical protein DHS20C15_29010 [Planctomycetota bacterium]|nr:MAG: hypothetical protein DHS20C15_29010 [Planctomycetota bacterium]